MKCPVCSTRDLLMTERQGVEIDYCPGCRGVWLDRGELDKLIERTDGSATMPAHLTRGGDRNVRDERDQHIEREYRKESQGHGFGHNGDHRRDAHYGHDDRRRHYDQPRKKKSLFEMFDFD
ncbi:zf-TFIIB domain-containing protein [Pandoraea pneumonica]|uniref:TFIIB-type zinc ribbon-containing protein n=1 Tax=Pandoraea pneumonica TaxID=2508299 RepID=UPI003CF5E455